MNYQTDVCIVGGGPGGALLAYILAKAKIFQLYYWKDTKA